MRRWHTEAKPNGRGWSDVGYHYFIRKTGRLEVGRPLERTPAAQRGHNTGTIAICLHGLEQSKFTGHQFNALSRLCRQINQVYDEQVTFHGHREVADKDCPVFDYRRVLGLGEDGVMSKPHDTARQSVAGGTAIHPVLRRTAKGSAVVVLQELLNLRGAALKVDGVFGRQTFEAVLTYQVSNGLVADGIVGPATWNALTAIAG
jgi:N-acetyl-anhydromuramyl-L-alanine amidase AmpD